MKKIRVVHIITRLDRGGAPDVVRAIFEKSDPEGFEHSLIYGRTVSPTQATSAWVKGLGDRARCVKSLRRDIHPVYDLAALFALTRLLWRRDYDIVHAHTAKAGFLGRLAARLAGARSVIYSPHGHEFYGYFGRRGSRFVVMAERFAGLFCDVIHLLTGLESDDFLKYRICPRRKLRVITSGVDRDRLRPMPGEIEALGHRWRVAADEPIVGFVGRLEPVKGPSDFVRAAALLIERIPRARFLVVGDGSLRSDLEALARDLNVADRFIWAGWMERVAPAMCLMRVLVMPSLNEAVGRCALEAQAMGIPVVATRVGGVPEMIQDTVTGLLVEPGDAPALAAAEALLLEDEIRRATMSEAARRWIEEHFDEMSMVHAFERLYREQAER